MFYTLKIYIYMLQNLEKKIEGCDDEMALEKYNAIKCSAEVCLESVNR